MVQNCCSKCMSQIGQFLCFVICCKCCCCCKNNKEKDQQDVNLNDRCKKQTDFQNFGDEGSIYNGSSIYNSSAVINKQPISDSGTSGIYLIESSLGSISLAENQNEMKLQISCDIKGVVDMGGIQQPVKGVLNIVQDDNIQAKFPVEKSVCTINSTLMRSARDSFLMQQNKILLKKLPKPSPRTQEVETNYSNAEKESDVQEVYLDPKYPIPIKQIKATESMAKYNPVYGNITDIKISKKFDVVTKSTEVINNNNSLLLKHASYATIDGQDEHVYEDIYPRYQNT